MIGDEHGELLFGLPDFMMQEDIEGSTLIAALVSEALTEQGKTGRWTIDPDMALYRPRASTDIYLWVHSLDTGEQMSIVLYHDPYVREEGPRTGGAFKAKGGSNGPR